MHWGQALWEAPALVLWTRGGAAKGRSRAPRNAGPGAGVSPPSLQNRKAKTGILKNSRKNFARIGWYHRDIKTSARISGPKGAGPL